MTKPELTGLDHLVLTVGDMDDTVAFYTRALGMTETRFTVADGTIRSALAFGSIKINLHPADAPFAPHARTPARGSADLCLLTNAPLDDWIAHLQHCEVELLDGPVPRTGARGPMTSIYLRDPDGNLIEIACYD